MGPKEIAERFAAGRARAERVAQEWTRPTASPQLEEAIERAAAALRLVISDVESTTDVREDSLILRYDDWIFESTQDPSSWLLSGGDDVEPEDELSLACRFGGHTFALDGDQSMAELADDIANYVQDDVTDEIWAAWPRCPGHEHPMSPTVAAKTAVWTCPADERIVVPIGELGAGRISPSSDPSALPPA